MCNTIIDCIEEPIETEILGVTWNCYYSRYLFLLTENKVNACRNVNLQSKNSKYK